MALTHPLTDEHLKILNAIIEGERVGRMKIANCKACGLDTSEAEAMLKLQVDTAKAIKVTHFPDS
jgi:hypothetical protein